MEYKKINSYRYTPNHVLTLHVYHVVHRITVKLLYDMNIRNNKLFF